MLVNWNYLFLPAMIPNFLALMALGNVLISKPKENSTLIRLGFFAVSPWRRDVMGTQIAWTNQMSNTVKKSFYILLT